MRQCLNGRLTVRQHFEAFGSLKIDSGARIFELRPIVMMAVLATGEARFVAQWVAISMLRTLAFAVRVGLATNVASVKVASSVVDSVA